MDINWILLLCFVVIALLALFAFMPWRKKRPSVKIEDQINAAGFYTPATPVIPHDEIIELLRTRQKIRAIKLYRQQTGCGLREAKEAVERIETEQYDPSLSQSQGTYSATENSQASNADFKAEVTHLLAANRKIQAIKLYRQQTGCGLREAKEAVDLLEQTQSSGPKW